MLNIFLICLGVYTLYYLYNYISFELGEKSSIYKQRHQIQQGQQRQ